MANDGGTAYSSGNAANRFTAELLGCFACLPVLGAFRRSGVPRCSEPRSGGCWVLLRLLPL